MSDQEDQEPEKDFLDIDLDEAIGEQAEMDEEALRAVAPMVDAPKVEAGPGILRYENKKYAVGLKWLMAEDEGDTDLASARAKGFQADFYALRQNVVAQQGFGFLSMGHRVGMPALAALAADVLVGEWHGIFTVDNGWWYVAVHADNIAPNGDILFASEEEAYNHFTVQAQGYKWPRTYAPESWNIADSTGEIPLSKLLGEAPAPQLKAASLDAVFSGKRNKNIALASGLLLIGLLGISLLGQQFLPSLIPMQAQIPVPNLQVSDLLQAPPKQPLIEGNEQDDFLTSFSLPKPSAYISECLKGFADISVALPGWQLNKIICGSSFTEAQWERQIGSLSLIKPFLDRFPQGTVRSFVDNKSFKATRRLKGERTLSPPAALMNETAATMLLTERFALMGDLKLQTVTPAASQDLLTAVDEMQQARFGASRPDLRPLGRDDLPFIAITLKSTTPPNILLRYFDIAGTMLNMIEGDLGEGMWQYNAKLILKPDKRLVEANKKAKAMQMK